MKLIKRLLLLVLVLVVTLFGVFIGINNQQLVKLDLAVFTLPDMLLGMLFIATLGVGFVCGWLFGWLRSLRLHVRLANAKRQLQQAQVKEQPRAETQPESKAIAAQP